MQGFEHFSKLIAKNLEDYKAKPRIGHVLNYNAQNYTAQVELQPSGQPTAYLPILSLWVGNGWGLFSPPIIGQQVLVHFLEDDLESGIISLYTHNNVELPIACPSGEFWLVHQNGCSIKLTNQGGVLINAPNAINILSPSVNAGVSLSSVEKIVKETFVALFNEHTHPVGGGDTGAPNQQMGSSHLTTNFEAS